MIEIQWPVKPPAWSFSAIDLYKTCARKYCAERVTKEVPRTDNEITLYGQAVHKACEDYVNGVPLEPRFAFCQDLMERIMSIGGTYYPEQKMGLKKIGKAYVACDFFDPEVYFRGVADLVIVSEDGTKAKIYDYKTNKSARYAKPDQLALMAACVFAKFPEVEQIDAGLLFLIAGSVVKETYTRAHAFSIFDMLSYLIKQREASYESGVFNANPNPLCRAYCDVMTCPHNGKRR